MIDLTGPFAGLAIALAFLLPMLGICVFVERLWSFPTISQAEREALFLAQQVASRSIPRGDHWS